MQPQFRVLGLPVTLTEAAFVAAAALAALAVLRKETALRLDPLYLPIGVYASALLFAALFSIEPRLSLMKLPAELYLMGLAFLAFHVVTTGEMMRKVVLVWIAAATVTAAAGVLAVASFYLGFSNFITELALHPLGTLPAGNYPRLQGTFLYASLLCNYMSVSLLLLFAARRMDWIGAPAFAVLTAMFAVTLAFTLTPGLGGAILGVAVWMALALAADGRRALPRLLAAGGVAAALAFTAAAAFNPGQAPVLFTLGGIAIGPGARALTWAGAFDTFLQYPLFGKGLGLGVAEVYFPAPSGERLLLTDAHNAALSVAAQAGIAGAAALVWLCVAIVRRTLPFQLTPERTLITTLGIAFIAAFIVQGLVGSFENARHLWLLIGLIMAAQSAEARAPARA